MTSLDDIEQKLDEVKPKTIAARLKPLWPAIEAKIEQGVAYQDIVDALNEAGFVDLKVNTFKRTLTRYRANNGATRATGKPVVKSQPNGNSTVTANAGDIVSPQEKTVSDSLDDILDARKGDALGDQYAGLSKPFLKRT